MPWDTTLSADFDRRDAGKYSTYSVHELIKAQGKTLRDRHRVSQCGHDVGEPTPSFETLIVAAPTKDAYLGQMNLKMSLDNVGEPAPSVTIPRFLSLPKYATHTAGKLPHVIRNTARKLSVVKPIVETFPDDAVFSTSEHRDAVEHETG